jgi:hypothetical protein
MTTTNNDELRAAVERAEHRLKLVKKKVAQFRNDYDPKDPRNGAGNRHCAHLIRNAEGNFNWAKHKLATSE